MLYILRSLYTWNYLHSWALLPLPLCANLEFQGGGTCSCRTSLFLLQDSCTYNIYRHLSDLSVTSAFSRIIQPICNSHERFPLNISKQLFTARVTNHRHRLPRVILSSPSRTDIEKLSRQDLGHPAQSGPGWTGLNRAGRPDDTQRYPLTSRSLWFFEFETQP